jgi:hypothetical protein
MVDHRFRRPVRVGLTAPDGGAAIVTDVEFKGSLAGGNESQGNLPHLEFENPFDFNLQDNDQILGGDRGAVGASVGADIGVEAAIDVNISIPDTIDAVLKYFDSE